MAMVQISVEDAGTLVYDGSQIRPLWAFSELGVQGDSVVFFRGGMKVPREALLDIEDLRESQKINPLTAEDAIHFIVEHFDDPSLRLAYHRQRILINVAKERIIDTSGVHVKRMASDLYVDDKKLSVSVATASASSSKIHLGVNIKSSGVPEGVKATGLKDLGVTDISLLAKDIADSYIEDIAQIEEDLTKTKVF